MWFFDMLLSWFSQQSTATSEINRLRFHWPMFNILLMSTLTNIGYKGTYPGRLKLRTLAGDRRIRPTSDELLDHMTVLPEP